MGLRKNKKVNLAQNVKAFENWLMEDYNFQGSNHSINMFHECFKTNETFHFVHWSDMGELFLKFGEQEIFYQIADEPKNSKWVKLPKFDTVEENEPDFHVAAYIRTHMYDTFFKTV